MTDDANLEDENGNNKERKRKISWNTIKARNLTRKLAFFHDNGELCNRTYNMACPLDVEHGQPILEGPLPDGLVFPSENEYMNMNKQAFQGGMLPGMLGLPPSKY